MTAAPAGLSEQLAAVSDDPVRVLVVGAGVAGTTLAGHLRRAGWSPVLVDRRGADGGLGYMLGLVPLVDPVLEHLGVAAAHRERSVPVRRYVLRDRAGRPLRRYPLDGLLTLGDYRGIERGELLAVLGDAGGPVTYGTTVSGLVQSADVVRADFSDGRTAEFDVVVAADGVHSGTRSLVMAPERVSRYDTGWGGWVGWTAPDDAPDQYEECWGPGFFVGTYPVRGRTGFFVGGPRRLTGEGPAAFAERVRRRLRTDDRRTARALTAVAEGSGVHFWPLADVRAASWSSGRVGLLGDAAAGFLPTAGIGAAMAMESAAVLGRLLQQGTAAAVPELLRRFEAVQRSRVQSAQENSRWLARLVFRTSRPVAVARDAAFRRVPLAAVLGPIRRLHRDRPVRP
ncbi:FAD-dependent oxidoreductase [Geodermatophilus sp. SYSU D00079]